jgi:hypothetical protein
MSTPLSQLPEAEQQVLIVIAFLAKRRAPRPREDVTAWEPRFFGMFQVDWTGAYHSLLARGLLALEAGQLVLILAGQPVAEELSLQNPKYLYFYNEFYARAAASPAHARFCERVYRKNLAQHGMADMGQVDWMTRTLGLGPHSRVLELGCGNGGVGEYISDRGGWLRSGDYAGGGSNPSESGSVVLSGRRSVQTALPVRRV